MATLFTLLSNFSSGEVPANVQSDFCWSAAIPPLAPDYALAVNLMDGSVDEQGKDELNYNWPVH